ncbi:MAG TPA: phosphate ABC transporter ATP-binding protein [Verrucomicrobiae bacterium]|jgi:phosphate transport system ATP-binding protein|nr:phosphate ABC transporter ATP-binding protein [Verrucomicrobiae bacterium]
MVEDFKAKLQIKGLSVFFADKCVLKDVWLDVRDKEILGIIGPANSGKTTLLRTLNRLNDRDPFFRRDGMILLDGEDIYHKININDVRKRIGMIFAMPAPLPLSIYGNVAYGPQVHGVSRRADLDVIVEKSLRAAFLWDEVKDRLDMPGMKLSGGQQQRLCIARTLAVEPDVILYDEPCSGLDPISTAKVEEAMTLLKDRYTQVLVTNNTKQAARVSDRTAFFLTSELVEIGDTEDIFRVPQDKRTEDYVSGRFG